MKAVVGRLKEFLVAYRRTLDGDVRRLVEDYRFVDLARKVVGVGSVGTRAWIVLLLGRDEEDPLFLQARRPRPRSWRASPARAGSIRRAAASSRGSA